MKSFFLFLALVALCAGPLRAAQTESMADRKLRQLVDRQKEIFATAAKQGDKADMSTLQTQAQLLVHDYELLARENPKSASVLAAYGYFLCKVGMNKEAAAILLRADQLDPTIPLVKNQLGGLLAEDGKPVLAAGYFLAAVKLAPDEPIYHYQLGIVLAEGRDDFLKTDLWTRETLDQAMSDAFKRATELAPDRFEFAYRYAESFYDLEKPDWDLALKLWNALEEKAGSPIERQTMRLHAANIYAKLGKRDRAEALLASVDEPALAAQKAKVVAQLAAPAKP